MKICFLKSNELLVKVRQRKHLKWIRAAAVKVIKQAQVFQGQELDYDKKLETTKEDPNERPKTENTSGGV